MEVLINSLQLLKRHNTLYCIAQYTTTLGMSKPVILIPSYDDEHPQHGLPGFLRDIANPHFELVTESDVKKDTSLLDKVVGLISHPTGWDFYTPNGLDKLKQLQMVSTASAGYNHLDFSYLKRRGIRHKLLASTLYSTTFEMAKPVVIIPSYDDEHPQHGLPGFVREIANPYFQLVTESDVKVDTSLLEKVVGVMSHPSGWDFYTPNGLDKLKNVKVVSSVSAGYNHLDFNYLKKRGIRVGYTPGVLNDAVADSAMALILATARKFKAGIEAAMGEKEIKAFSNRVSVFGNDVTGKTLGIVGMGNIGLEVAKRSTGFRMKVLYHNRNKREDDVTVSAKYFQSLHDMLPLCDFIVITCALNESTTNLFTQQEFKLMKNTSTIVNVSRGPIIDHQALADALESGEIQAAGLDVTAPEPLPRTHPLLKLENVLITPHLGSQTLETRTMMFQRAIDNLKAAIIDNKPMPSELNF